MEARSTTTETTAEETLRSRLPNPVELVPEIEDVAGLLYKAIGNRTVPQATIGLVHLRAGQIVGNTYLTIMHSDLLRKGGESEERIAAVASWRDAPYFTGAERAALALVEAVLQPNPDGERVSDALFAEVSEHYDTKALITLTVAIGQVNFFIPLALIGKPLPGTSPVEQWT
ncbi:carboxymuconolactone decarboxylase family protein [Streptomyces sp. NPDC091268]|uniref:carboxymuconolactone decarboxylase family protein n=1 Tax=Streptomyces sp. NPDC091268 TaxID=3365979 RepID=UPI00380617FC